MVYAVNVERNIKMARMKKAILSRLVGNVRYAVAVLRRLLTGARCVLNAQLDTHSPEEQMNQLERLPDGRLKPTCADMDWLVHFVCGFPDGKIFPTSYERKLYKDYYKIDEKWPHDPATGEKLPPRGWETADDYMREEIKKSGKREHNRVPHAG